MKSYTFKHWSMFMSLLLFSIMVLQLSSLNIALAANQRYVATNGNDSNNDCADSNNPCQTIQHAIDEATVGETVLVEPGTYVENINFKGKNIVVGSLFVTTNDPSYISQTVIDGNQNGSVVTFENGEDATAVLQGFTITNGSGTYFAPYTHTGAQNHYGGGIFMTGCSPTLANLIIEGNTVAGGGAGVWSHISEPTVVDSVIRNNTASGEGGGIGFVSHHIRYPTLSNLLITGNSAKWGGGALINYSTRATLKNVTISGNTASTSGGAIFRANYSGVTVVNSIIWNNNPAPIHWDGGWVWTSEVSYSNVEGGQTGSHINWGAGNLDVDPQFVDAANGDFHLSDNSPLLGVGTLQNAPATDLDGNARPSPAGSNPDLGAYESQPELNLCGCEIDLVNNTHSCQGIDPISFVYGPATNQAVVKFSFDPTLYNHNAVRFDVEYGGEPNGWTVNIGDSQSNNGYSGDGAHQSHDAEMQIVNDKMTIYASDVGGSSELFSQNSLVAGGTTLSLEVRDGHLFWDNHSGIVSQLDSPYLYALNGQADNEGSVNYDIYAGFNRTIGSGARNGSGATKVTISCLEKTDGSEVPIGLQSGWNLVSVPVQPTDSDISQVLASIAGNYDLVYAYDGCDTADHWKSFNPSAAPFANDLTDVNEKMGVWIHMTTADTLSVSGTTPGTTDISLCEGWNLTGNPSSQQLPVADALMSISGAYDLIYAYEAADTADPWASYNPSSPPFANDLTEMGAGWGYWMKANQDATWTINN